jgi:hypothetical protein
MAKNDNLKDFLTDLADAIREKKGTSGPINPQDFTSEIASIETGGGGIIPDYYSEEGVLEYKDAVRFFDYDGTILYTYAIEEAKALEELPPLPLHEGLICQGWNYTLDDIRAQDLFCEIGATYITEDGATRCYISINDPTSRDFTIYVGSGSEVNWGDGFVETYQYGARQTHIYQSIGEYVVSIKKPGGGNMVISTSSYSFINSTSWNSPDGWDSKVKKIHFGNISNSTINLGCFNELEVLTFPIGIYDFYSYNIVSKKLKSITYPRGVEGLSSIRSYSGSGFLIEGFRVSIPNTVTKISGNYLVYGAERIIRPSSAVSILNYEGDFATDVVSHVCKSNSPVCKLSLAKSVISGSSATSGSTIVKVVSKESPNTGTSSSSCAIAAQIRNGKLIKTKDIIIPEGVERIENYAFYKQPINSFIFPDGITSIDYYAFSLCQARLYDFSAAKSIPNMLHSSIFTPEFDFRILVPVELYDDWKSATNWSTLAKKIYYDYVPTECIKLELNVRNVSGREEFATIEYIATTNGVRKNGERVENILLFGSTTSERFGVNPSYEDSIERQISFTYLDLTSTVTITQTPFYDLCMKCKYNVTSNSQSTSILNRATGLSTMSIDGGEDIPVSTSHLFDTIGEHEVVFKPTNDKPPTNLYYMFYGITALNDVDCSLLDMSAADSSATNNGTAYMFYQCSNLKKIILPSTIKYMGRYMFRYCSNVESLTILARKAPTLYSYQTFGYSSSDFIGYNNKDNGTNKFYVPKGASGYNVSPWTYLLSTSYCGFTLEEIDEQ